MKAHILFLLIIFNVTSTYANNSYIAENQVYRAIEQLAQYAHEKDQNLNLQQMYYQILHNSEERGLQHGVIEPLRRFYSMKHDPQKRYSLLEIMNSLHVETPLPAAPDNSVKPFNPRKNIDIVANSSNECVGSCVRDVIDNMTKGAAIGAAVGAGGGPAVAAGSAAAGAAIGGAMGGVSCSTRSECKKNDKEQKKIVVPKKDLEGPNRLNIAEVKRKKFDVVVNNGPRGWRGN